MQQNIINNLAGGRSLLDAIEKSQQTFTVPVSEEPIGAKRKQLELNLVREIDKAIANGLDLQFIAIELGKVTNVRVSLKDEQAT